ncbi:MAG: hypothetical protein ABS86_06555 [Sphingobium sp. SCN 64-10]|nr:MAG: hypothetical protein ABS86_06555 [Sphingobium sp. SCN 64-10]
MAALSVSVVGGPMTLAILMLETTHDFALMGVVLTATLISSAFTREVFGYSFSTWRLHLRGANVRSPRDIGWMLKLNAARVMRKDWAALRDDVSVAEFRARIPLGSTSKTVITDVAGHYRGIVTTASAYRPELAENVPITKIATQHDVVLPPDAGIEQMLRLFDEASVDEIAVVDHLGKVVGVVTEKHARRRYFEELEAAQRAIFRE